MTETYNINNLKKEFGTDKKYLDYIYNLKYKDLNHWLNVVLYLNIIMRRN